MTALHTLSAILRARRHVALLRDRHDRAAVPLAASQHIEAALEHLTDAAVLIRGELDDLAAGPGRHTEGTTP